MIERIRLKYQENFIWLYPIKYILTGFLLAIFMILVDNKFTFIHNYLPKIILTSRDFGQSILISLLTAILSMTIFTFSTTMVVLTMYSSQFSPRVVGNFLKDKITLRGLGIFIGGFFYMITALLFMRRSSENNEVISSTVGMIYSMVCLLYFVLFIYKVSNMVQATNLISKLEKEASITIDQAIENFKDVNFIRDYEIKGYNITKNIFAEKSGYLQNIDYEEVKNMMNKEGIENYNIEILINNGSYVLKDRMMAKVHLKKDYDYDFNNINSIFVIEDNRMITYDYLLSLEKLVDIALRSLSPGINDPNTAVECINILGNLLVRLSKIDGNYTYIRDKESNGEIVFPYFSFKRDLYLVYYQVVIYGAQDLNVIVNLIRVLKELLNNATSENRKYIREFIDFTYNKTKDNFKENYELDILKSIYK